RRLCADRNRHSAICAEMNPGALNGHSGCIDQFRYAEPPVRFDIICKTETAQLALSFARRTTSGKSITLRQIQAPHLVVEEAAATHGQPCCQCHRLAAAPLQVPGAERGAVATER